MRAIHCGCARFFASENNKGIDLAITPVDALFLYAYICHLEGRRASLFYGCTQHFPMGKTCPGGKLWQRSVKDMVWFLRSCQRGAFQCAPAPARQYRTASHRRSCRCNPCLYLRYQNMSFPASVIKKETPLFTQRRSSYIKSLFMICRKSVVKRDIF